MSFDAFKPLNNYCERLDPSFWAEPINALTNLSFVFAFLYGIWIWKQTLYPSRWTLLLSLNALLIGIGSFLFHTYANVWSLYADVIPISIFMLLFLYFGLRRLLKLQLVFVIPTLVAFAAVGVALDTYVPKTFLNGSAGYLHAFAALAIVGHFLRDSHWHIAKLFLVAMGIFAVSLTFRSIDMQICELFPLGTHFLWHTLNGALLAVLIHATALKRD